MHKGLEIRHMAPPAHQPKHPELQWVHQTAPSNPDKWHRMWHQCQPSWKKLAEDNGMQYKLWSDEELDSFVKSEYPDFYDCCYSQYPAKIQKIDAARPLILHRYGGIYADMDFETCNSDWLQELPLDKPHVVESPYKENEDNQNALMLSPPGDSFWLEYVDQMRQRRLDPSVLDSTGPRALDAAIKSCKEKRGADCVGILPTHQYNPATMPVFALPSASDRETSMCTENTHTFHHGTGSWLQ